MTSRSRLVKREQEVDEDEEDVDTFPFDDEDSTNLKDPLAINDEDLDFSKAEMKAGIVKEEVGDCDGDVGRRLRSHLNENENPGKPCKIIIIVKDKPRMGHGNAGRPRKYATREERLKAKADRQRLRWAKMKEEAREEMLRKQRERDHKRLAKMKEEIGNPKNETVEKYSNDSGPEQVAEVSQSQPNQRLTRYEELLKRQRERSRRQRVENPEKYEEQKEKQRERKKKLKEDNPEKYQENRTNATGRKRKQRQTGEIKKSPKELTEEQKEIKRMLARLRAAKDRERIRFAHYSTLQMKIAQMTDEELAAYKAKRREAAKKWRENLSGEKLEKYRTHLRNNSKKQYHKKRLGMVNKDIINARCRHYVANETPEQRQKRLRRYKINQAITRLRKQLEEIDVPPEEVERRVTELKRTMEAEPLPPPETLSKYKPRVKTEMNFSFSPRSYEGRRRGRTPGSSSKVVVVSKSQGSCDSLSQAGKGSPEMGVSNDFDDHGFQCDSPTDDEQNKIDHNRETTTTDLDPIPILRFDIKCPHCPSTYSERSDLISHISSEHSEICWKCPKCKLIVLSSDELSEHYKSEHFPVSKRSTVTSATVSKESSSKKENTFTCIKCDPVKLQSPHFESVKDLMAHVELTHPNSFWPCSKCNILKYSESALKVHKKVCKRTKTTTKPRPRAGEKGLVKKYI